MKLVPGPLPPLPTGATMDRLPLPLAFNPELLWRYPIGFPSATAAAAAQVTGPIPSPTATHPPPSSPMLDFKTHLPTQLASDPRVWSRDDCITFLKWCEREFDLQPFDLDMFQMNGKALCLLNRTDLSERSPGAGDVLHNVLQLLVRDATVLQRCLPSSPVTPTSRYPLSSHPNTPTWSMLTHNEAFHPSHAALAAAHLMAQSNSVTLSPAPSVDSQAGSPQHIDNAANQITYVHSVFGCGSGSGSGSNQGSDSDEDSYQVANSPHNNNHGLMKNNSPPNTPSAIIASLPRSPKEGPVSGAFQPVGREFFPVESPEPNTNGRLLWDFLQQLLNDPTQRYTKYIAWKNRDTGVFKIVDPAGLAKLWGIQKNHLSMNYDKMSRALRYYYRVNILRKVQGERHCYQFLRNPTELKNIKNISLLRQQMSPTRLNAPVGITTTPTTVAAASVTVTPSIPTIANVPIKSEPGVDTMEHSHEDGDVDCDDEKPTDLSMMNLHHQRHPTDLSTSTARLNSGSANTQDTNSDQFHHMHIKPDLDGDK